MKSFALTLLVVIPLYLATGSAARAEDYFSKAIAEKWSGDFQRTAQLYELVGNVETPNAQYNRGQKYYFGKGVPKNYAEAMRWYLKAAQRRHSGALGQIGLMYYEGKGVPKNYAEAMRWFRKAAEMRYSLGYYYIGNMYYHGQGVPKNYAEAMRWFRKAAGKKRGIAQAHAQSQIGRLYEKGLGVPKDVAEAIRWYRKAAEKGHPYAKARLKKLGKK